MLVLLAQLYVSIIVISIIGWTTGPIPTQLQAKLCLKSVVQHFLERPMFLRPVRFI